MPAPGLFSITIGWPSRVESFSDTARATMSTPPPGGNGTTTRSVFAGYACARASAGANSSAGSSLDILILLGEYSQAMDLDDTLIALADDTRRSILKRLASGEARVTDVA